MKLTSFVRTLLTGVACMGFMLSVAVGASTESKTKGSLQKYQLNSTAVKPKVVWVYVTDSRIPQRVVLRGQHADSSSPMFVVQGEELSRTGATSVYGMLGLDPSISLRSPH